MNGSNKRLDTAVNLKIQKQNLSKIKCTDKRWLKKNEGNLSELCDPMSHSNIQIIGVLET